MTIQISDEEAGEIKSLLERIKEGQDILLEILKYHPGSTSIEKTIKSGKLPEALEKLKKILDFKEN